MFEISFFNFFLSSAFFSVGLSLHSSAVQGHKFILIVKTKKLSTFISSLWIPSQKLFAKVEPCDHCQWTRYKSQTKKNFFRKTFWFSEYLSQLSDFNYIDGKVDSINHIRMDFCFDVCFLLILFWDGKNMLMLSVFHQKKNQFKKRVSNSQFFLE